MNIQLVSLDVSGTIVKYVADELSQRIADSEIRSYLSALDVQLSEDEIRSAITCGFEGYRLRREKDFIEIAESEFYREYVLPTLPAACQRLTDEQIEAVARLWRELSVAVRLNTTKLELLTNELHARGLEVVTVSDMLGPMTEYALKQVGVWALFGAHFASSNFGVRKAHASDSLFTRLAALMRVPPMACLHIGNDFSDDIEASYRAGWGRRVFLTFGRAVPGEGTKMIDLVAQNLDEFYRMLVEGRVRFLPDLKQTPFTGEKTAQQLNHKNTQLLFALRQLVKTFPDRAFREWAFRSYLAFHIGSTTRIGTNLEIRFPERIYIGDNCQLNDDITILNEGPVVLGDHVMIARGGFIGTHYHDWRLGMLEEQRASWAKGRTRLRPVSIEDNVWIGPNVTLEAGSFIGHHSIVAANSLVQGGVYEPFSFIAGSPARQMRSIRDELEKVRRSFVSDGFGQGGERNDVSGI